MICDKRRLYFDGATVRTIAGEVYACIHRDHRHKPYQLYLLNGNFNLLAEFGEPWFIAKRTWGDYELACQAHIEWKRNKPAYNGKGFAQALIDSVE